MSPIGQTEEILAFLDLDMKPQVEEFCRNKVSVNNIGKWRDQISSRDLEKIKGLVDPVLEQSGLEI
jgi:hypothetical protein